ncbi:MAG: toll/interleukin-1 receptor domain-containing protein, partial [Acidobacteriota bacterium]
MSQQFLGRKLSMDATPDAAPQYDIFLAYGSADKEQVRKLYESLRRRNYSVFFDLEELESAMHWRQTLEVALRNCKSFGVCVGGRGPGPWTDEEVSVAVSRSVDNPTFALFPIFLPGGGPRECARISEFLKNRQAVDLKDLVPEKRWDDDLESLIRVLDQVRAGRIWREEGPQLPIGHIQEGFERLQNRFFDSLRPLLAGGQKIERDQTHSVLDFLGDEKKRIVVIQGSAGSGKSGVLLDVADHLQEDGRPFLPLRLDRYDLKSSPERLAANELSLPASPGECLAALGRAAGETKPVLLLDQLDAMRWTGAHSGEAWSVCREVIEGALAASPSIKIVVCCRSFDLEHDPQLRAWKEASEGYLGTVLVSSLTDEQVTAAIERAAEGQKQPRPIGVKEMRLLQHIHHLQMWLTLYPNMGERDSFSTRRALMEAFWQNRREQLTKHRVPMSRVDELEDRLLREMRDGKRLTASLSPLRLSGQESQAYQSLQILHVDPAQNRVSFCHQSYLDYLVAVRLVDRLSSDATDLPSWLGAPGDQSLYRREQLRLVLEELRDREREVYLKELRRLLQVESPIRFHLRLLGLQFLSQLVDPTAEEKELVLELLATDYWHEHVLEDIVRGRAAWFEALDDAGCLEDWLEGDEADWKKAINLLQYAAEASGDRVARVLRPYLGRSEEWNYRIRYVLRVGAAGDSDDLFELRMALVEQGLYAKYVRWDELALKDSDRYTGLVFETLLRFAKDVAIRQSRRAARDNEPQWHGL